MKGTKTKFSFSISDMILYFLFYNFFFYKKIKKLNAITIITCRLQNISNSNLEHVYSDDKASLMPKAIFKCFHLIYQSKVSFENKPLLLNLFFFNFLYLAVIIEDIRDPFLFDSRQNNGQYIKCLIALSFYTN
jgi:hypothetical protein